MEIKVRNEVYNPLLKRKEISLEIEHAGEGTPQRFDVRKRMAAKLNARIENVFVVSLDTATGLQRSTCSLQVYDDPRVASSTVPEHVAVRNLSPEERAKVKEAKAEKAAKPAEKREAKPGKVTEAKPAAKTEAKAPAEASKPAK